jgi:Tfp pilus assembly protein PilV
MRSQSGSLLIEAMVAMFIGSIMALAIVALLAQCLRVSSATSNQMAADQIANSVFETLKQYKFATIKSFDGQTINLNINSLQFLPPVAEPILLGLDSTSFQWTPLSVSNAFPGYATLQVSAPANTAVATVVVQWSDSSLKHSATYATVINAGGEDYWY